MRGTANDKPMKAMEETAITAQTAYRGWSARGGLKDVEVRSLLTQYQSDPWVVMAMSEVAPLTKWSPLAWIALFERLSNSLAIFRVVCSSRCEGVVVAEV